MQGSTLNTYKVMAVWMMKCRLLLQKLTGHISEVSNQNKLKFGLVWFPYGPNMWANFQRNLRGWRFFFVDLVWNDPHAFFLQPSEVDRFCVHNCPISQWFLFILMANHSIQWLRKCNLKTNSNTFTCIQLVYCQNK